jgi:hypothetical protein
MIIMLNKKINLRRGDFSQQKKLYQQFSFFNEFSYKFFLLYFHHKHYNMSFITYYCYLLGKSQWIFTAFSLLSLPGFYDILYIIIF